MGWCLDCHRNPQQYVIPAREISGIFTGTKTNEQVAQAIRNDQPSWGEGKWKPVRSKTVEAIGTSDHQLGQCQVAGVQMPKKLALGPENCSSCHY
jgi:hypothetical protein